MYYMLDMSNNQQDENKKTVTIRGVNRDLYERMVNVARNSGKTVGEVMNQAMMTFLGLAGKVGEKIDEATQKAINVGKAFVEGYNEAGKNIFIVSDLEELRITKNEIIGLGKPVSFRNIKRLILDDIDQQTIDQYIDSIITVDEVVVPSSVNKLLLLQKCKFVKRVVTI
ncbi:hypothetical protein [Sulfurisphaera tokodaii]|uniref:Uncharacterized protein n=3 Tax=Sulfolobaceae TaxID=118883 RepID=Q96XR9_SULTO|nr:hypothetical protein [Sulfurisphaera tokodaii]BAB67558.1 hypothetical protein STK_24480 [Sulfurisphaera tokodaii str. 7]